MKAKSVVCLMVALLISLPLAFAEDNSSISPMNTDGVQLPSYIDVFPGDAALEAELFREESTTPVVISSAEGNRGMIGLLPDVVFFDGYSSVADAGRLGSDTFWVVKTDGTLHIVGTGDMGNFIMYNMKDGSTVPWEKYCDRITGAVIHEGITNVIDKTFSSCPNMKTIQISSTVTDIEDTTIWSSGVEEINVDHWNNVYTSLDGVLYSKDVSTLLCFPPKKNVEGFVFPSSVKRIVSFLGNGMSSIRIPDQIRWIDSGAFSYCTSLQEIVLPSKLDRIEDHLFYGDTSLSSVTIPASVVSIGDSAFYDCHETPDIYYQGTREQWNQIDIEEHNYYLMASTIHFSDQSTFSAVQDEEYFWNTKTKKITSRIGKVNRVNAITENLHESYQVQVPADWEKVDTGVFAGKDADGNTAHLYITEELLKEYKGNQKIGLSNERITSEKINDILVNFVENYTPYDEYVAVLCWDTEYIYKVRVEFDNNFPLQTEKLVDDAAFIIGSLCKPGQEVTGEVIISADGEKDRCSDRLQDFYVYWCNQSLKNMLEYCTSEWKDKQTGDLKAQLLTCIPEGTPLICSLNNLDIKEGIAIADTEILIDHNDGKDPVNYRFTIQMAREDNEWFVNPESLLHYEEAVEEEKTGITEAAETPAKESNLTIPEGFESDEEVSVLCQEKLLGFMDAWARNSFDDMLDYCSLVWKTSRASNLHAKMFSLVTNMMPVSYTLNEIKTKGDDAYAALVVLIDRNNGKNPENYRMLIHLVRENGEWFIDPESLRRYEVAEKEEGAEVLYTPEKKTTLAIPEDFESDEEVSALCEEKLLGFFYAWACNSYDDILDYCSLDWKASNTSNLKVELFALRANRMPISYTLNEIKTKGDDAYAELVAVMDRNNGKEPVNHRMIIHLVREDGEWYIVPDSIQNYEIVEAQ